MPNQYPETSPLFNQDAIEALQKAGIKYTGTELRRKVLGCLACQWKKGTAPEAIVRQTAECLGESAASLYSPFHALTARDVIVMRKGVRRPEDPGNPPFRFYPNDTEVGIAFQKAIAPFEQCKIIPPISPES